jgi:hypothetical protein
MIVRYGTIDDETQEVTEYIVEDYDSYIVNDTEDNDVSKRVRSIKASVISAKSDIEQTMDEFSDPATVKKAASILGQAIFSSLFKDGRGGRG